MWVYQQGDDSLKEFMSHKYYKSLRTFSPSEYGGLSLCGSLAQEWAVEVGRAYEQSSEKESNEEKTWEGMTQYERWSSLYNVRSIIAKLRGLGYELRMDNRGDGKMRITCFLPNQPTVCSTLELKNKIDDLSRTEHIRWMVDTLTKGFRPTTEEEHKKASSDKEHKDNLKKAIFAHDDIRPFDDLSPQTAKYDKDMTQALIDAINAKVKKV